MLLTLDKLKARVPEIIAAAIRATRPLDHVLTCAAPGDIAESAMAGPPTADAPGWRPLRCGERWGLAPGVDPEALPRAIGWGIPTDGGSTHWLRATLRVPEEWRGEPVLLAMGWNGVIQSGLEAIAAQEGQALARLEEYRRQLLLQAIAHGDQASLEAILYLDGRALAGIDEYHRAVLLPIEAHERAHETLIRCYLPFAQRFGGLSLQLR